MMKRILLFILIGLSAGTISAQQKLTAPISANSIVKASTGKFYYAANRKNEPARAIEFNEQTVAASYFLTNINQYFDIPSKFTFVQTESNIDNIGMRHYHMQQFYSGIPIEGLGYRVHEKNGFVTSANGKAVRDISLDVNTVISEELAFHLATQFLQTKDTIFRNARKLIISKNFTFTPESFAVAYQFDIDVSLIEQWRISIDARTGDVLNKVSLVNSCENETLPMPYDTAVGTTNYYGKQIIQVEKFDGGASRMVGQTEHGGSIGTYDYRNASVLAFLFGMNVSVYNFYSPDNKYNTAYQRPAVSVQWAAEKSYEYYFTKHNRNSFDNNGSSITSYVHVDVDLNNAFWARNRLLFGDGINNNPLVELDIVGHELTHGVTQFEAALQYYNESGALNESFSDIFGKVIEFETFGDTATWQIGKFYRSGGLRDMSNPNLKDQPDTYAGDLWYTGYEDNGGVHYNSGVQNFWFYLLCEGGSGVNDHGVSYSVKSIGIDTAATIVYRNLTEYLSSLSDYLDSRIGSMLATTDLYGKNSLAYQEVDKAWDAVGVIDEPIITNLEAYDITATTVKLRGSLLPRGDTTTYRFEYGTTVAFGNSTPSFEYFDVVEGIVTGLLSETKYYVRLVATNENGSTNSPAIVFTTLSLAPLVKLKHTVDVSETSATLYGQVNPNSLPTSFYFEYGLTPTLGSVSSSFQLPDTTEFLNISAPITNLQPRLTYYYRLVATNSFTTSSSEQLSFFTAIKPIVHSFTPVVATSGTIVTIVGENFNATPGKNAVGFGATLGEIVAANETEIKVKVPKGASFGSLSVLDTETGLQAVSAQEFVPTFMGEFQKGDLTLRVAYDDQPYGRILSEDIDRDGKPDIVATQNQGFSVFQNVNTGGDITNESFIRTNHPTESFFDFLALVDMDGNGYKDLVGNYENKLRIYPNYSVPGYIFFGVPVDLQIGYWRWKEFKDIDQDGHIDIVAIGSRMPSDSSLLLIYRNKNPKGVLFANNFDLEYEQIIPYYVYTAIASDLDNDGLPDLLTTTFDTRSYSIFRNQSIPGNFGFLESIGMDTTRGRFAAYHSYDLNQDGLKDILAHSTHYTELEGLRLFEQRANAPLLTLEKPAIVLDEHPVSIQPSDIDGDGKVDLLIGDTDGKFIFIGNKTKANDHFLDSSFLLLGHYGNNENSSDVSSEVIVNDLNGDGRPEVINNLNYSFYPFKGHQIEIWQNAPNNCLNPTGIQITNVTRYTAKIELPVGTSLEDFEIEYAPIGANYWWQLTTKELAYLSAGVPYQLRARAKCYLGFTNYYYINFTTECVNLSSFKIKNIRINEVYLEASDGTNNYEIQYSQAGKNQWSILSEYSNQITNLLPGTSYDLRFRGRCFISGEFNYLQFTTICPSLSTLSISDITYNRAIANWSSIYSGNAILEYSTDNTTWTLVDETHTMTSLTPGQKYYVRGSLACTDTNSGFIYTSFTTHCPKISMLSLNTITPFSTNIIWEDESSTNSYNLTYSMTLGGEVTTIAINSTSFFLEGLQPGTRYSVSVAPECIGTKDFTSTFFTTVCYAPFNLTADGITHTSAKLSWEDHFSGYPYFIDYSIVGSNVWSTIETPLTTIELKDLRPGTEYLVQVHINCLSETAPYISIRFETSLYEETKFSPNPTDGKVTIHPSKNIIGSNFSLYENTGRRVANGVLLDYTIDLSGFQAGSYFLKIDGEQPMKIIKY